MYEASNGTFVGLHTPLGLQTTDGEDVCAITLVPQEYYSAMAFADRMKIIVASSLLFVVCAYAVPVFVASIRKADIRCG